MDPNIIPLIENEYIRFVFDQLKIATSKIFIIVFYSKIHLRRKNDDVKNLIEILIQKHNAGVKVLVLFNHSSKRSFITKANDEVADQLLKAGVCAKHTDTNRVTHAKLFLIDDNVSILGSHNLSERALHSNRELSLFVKSEQLNKKLTDYFLSEFYEASDKW